MYYYAFVSALYTFLLIHSIHVQRNWLCLCMSVSVSEWIKTISPMVQNLPGYVMLITNKASTHKYIGKSFLYKPLSVWPYTVNSF